MEIEILQGKNGNTALVTAEGIIINNVQDAVELIGNCSYQGAERIIISENNIVPVFFDLKTGIAGEVLQKFSTYQMGLTIVGDFSKYTSKSLHDFIFESNKTGRINFVATLEEAKEKVA